MYKSLAEMLSQSPTSTKIHVFSVCFSGCISLVSRISSWCHLRSDTLGTRSIEVVALGNTETPWPPDTKAILVKRVDLKDNEKSHLNTRPHRTKEWSRLHTRDIPITDTQTTITQIQLRVQSDCVADSGGAGMDKEEH